VVSDRDRRRVGDGLDEGPLQLRLEGSNEMRDLLEQNRECREAAVDAKENGHQHKRE
jgi:hypothetical protein